MRQARRHWAIALVLLGLLGCGGEPASGPGPVAWDRDTCDHCQMVISSRAFATQVRGADGHLHRFDDPGCAVLWMRGQEAEGAPREVWVHALEGEEWLDAREARFVEVDQTPMGYGYGARGGSSDLGIDFARLREVIEKLEDERRRPDH